MCRTHYQRWLHSKEGQATRQRYASRKEFHPPKDEVVSAYLAGLIDGDGSITLQNSNGGYWAVKIYMTDREIIDWLHAKIGGGRGSYLQKNRSRHMYTWNLLSQAEVRSFLQAIYPYLKVHAKQRKALDAMADIDAKADAKKSGATNGATTPLF